MIIIHNNFFLLKKRVIQNVSIKYNISIENIYINVLWSYGIKNIRNRNNEHRKCIRVSI